MRHPAVAIAKPAREARTVPGLLRGMESMVELGKLRNERDACCQEEELRSDDRRFASYRFEALRMGRGMGWDERQAIS